ncbi:MAG: PrgI family protein [Eubacteriales bacterium]|nr:PrgI family protein [Eubacteriales bacterium]
MEIKIPKEIRDYTEAIFFGLSIRQLIFSILAVGIAVLLYFGLQKYVGTETVSWLCILGAAPFAALGFIRYHGMRAEQLVAAWVKSELLMPKKLVYKAENLYAKTILKGDR